MCVSVDIIHGRLGGIKSKTNAWIALNGVTMLSCWFGIDSPFNFCNMNIYLSSDTTDLPPEDAITAAYKISL